MGFSHPEIYYIWHDYKYKDNSQMLTYKKILTFLNANVDLLYSILEICQIPVTFRLSDEQ